MAVITLVLAWFAPRFQLDASADSLLLEQDSDLRYYRNVVERYGSDDYLVVTYTAYGDLFSAETLTDLKQLRDSLRMLPGVAQVISMLDVPLIESPPVTLAGLQQRIPTLEDEATDRELARRELRESPVYSNLLMSLDGTTTALLLRLQQDEEYVRLLQQRDQLRESEQTAPLTVAEASDKARLDDRIKALRLGVLEREQATILQIREILAQHQQYAETHLGGLPMIVSDMIDYIRSDIMVFGSGILAFLVVLLSLIFRRPRWVAVSLLCCLVSVSMIVGLLGLLEWRVTVVSSNFVALMLIFSLSLTVHLIQRYRELHDRFPEADQRWLVRNTMRDKAKPCLFTALTTMVGFASLIISGIRPVIDFGWMMVMGMVAVLGTTFVLFPAVLMLLKPVDPFDAGDYTKRVTGFFALMVERYARTTAMVCVLTAVFSIWGISQLQVENRFVDYFKASTPIHQSLLVIDRQLGGTAPLDIILDADPDFIAARIANESAAVAEEFDDDFDDFDPAFDDDIDADFFDASAVDQRSDLGATSYWYNSFRLARLREVHDYLDSLPETGKVLSMATTLEMLQTLNQNEAPGTFFLSVLYKRVPDELKEVLIDPYMSADGNQVRINTRVIESDPSLRRDRLIREVRSHLVDEMGFHPDQVHVTGMLVLYNNVLQSLYRSQILTLGAVFVAIMLMFGLLFMSAKIALVAVVPSMLAVGIVLGVMGALGIPLDIMTITIAAISVGIGVDNSIHYIHRYRQEMTIDENPLAAMKRSHASVGRPMFYTSVIVVAGFSILILSNFIPSILFGLLTGLAMLMALVSNLTLLPLLLRQAGIR